MAKKNSKRLAVKIVIILMIAVFIGASYFARVQIEGLLNGNALASGTVEQANSANFAVHYINVGQGDSVYITLPDGKNMLIDAGSGKNEQKVLDYLNNLKVTKIDYLVLTHSDEDHSGGMDVVLENYAVSNIYRPFQIAIGTSSFSVTDPLAYYLERNDLTVNSVSTVAYGKFIKMAYEEKDADGEEASVCVFYDGLVIENSSVDYKFEFYAPLKLEDEKAIGAAGYVDIGLGFPTEAYSDTNNYSPFILLKQGTKKFVFTGDMEKEGEKDLVASLTVNDKNALKNVDVFKAGHHGSDTSSSADLLEIISPAYIVVSCGKDNSYGHPKPAFLSRAETALTARAGSSEGRIYRTDENGDVIFYNNNDSLGICAYNYTNTHYFTWFEVAGGTFVLLSIIVISWTTPKAGYKKFKKHFK